MQATPCTKQIVALFGFHPPPVQVQVLGSAHRSGAGGGAATPPPQCEHTASHRQRRVAGVLEGSTGTTEPGHTRCHRAVSRAFSVRQRTLAFCCCFLFWNQQQPAPAFCSRCLFLTRSAVMRKWRAGPLRGLSPRALWILLTASRTSRDPATNGALMLARLQAMFTYLSVAVQKKQMPKRFPQRKSKWRRSGLHPQRSPPQRRAM